MLEKTVHQKQDILKKTHSDFLSSNFLSIKIGIELEFFLLQKNSKIIKDQELLEDFIFNLKAEILSKFSLILDVEKEQGAGQIEIKTHFTDNLFELAKQVELTKEFTKNYFKDRNFLASFASCPVFDDCSNALQFNISLHDLKNDNQEDLFEYMIAGLLEKTNEMMAILAPKDEDYQRFSLENNQALFKKGKYTAPVNLSYGNDNRSCAIRILDNKKRKNKTLEYRVACADADVFLSMAAIILSIDFGIKNKLNLKKLGHESIFGNAFDDQYKLTKICKNSW